MSKKQRQQIEFILKVTDRYKRNGGYIYRLAHGGKVRVRCSLAEFILAELAPVIARGVEDASRAVTQ